MSKSGVINGWPGTYWLEKVEQLILPWGSPPELIERSTYLLRECQPLQEELHEQEKKLRSTSDKKTRMHLEDLVQGLNSELFCDYYEEIALNRAKLWLINKT
jgi:hypothetical protein